MYWTEIKGMCRSWNIVLTLVLVSSEIQNAACLGGRTVDVLYKSCDLLNPQLINYDTTTKSLVNIHSPGYPVEYPALMRCRWRVQASPGKKLFYWFNRRFHLEPGIDVDNCTNDYLKLYNGANDTAQLIGTYCSNAPPIRARTSAENIYVEFNSNAYYSRTGFSMYVTEWAGSENVTDLAGQCVEEVTSTKTISRDDDISEAHCPRSLFVIQCVCITVTNGAYCDGVTVTTDGKTCRAHGAHKGDAIKAKACCGHLESVTLISNPKSMTYDAWAISAKASQYKRAPTAECPQNTRLITCLLHTYWAHDYWTQTALRNGNRCVTQDSCGRCGVQAICEGTLKPSIPVVPPSSECCEKQLLSEQFAERDDKTVTVQCPGDLFVTKCTCVPLHNMGYCDGVTVSPDARSCRGHAARGGGKIKAKVCCGRTKTTPTIQDSSSEYVRGPSATCPSGQRPVSCALHTYWAEYKDEKATLDGNRCKTRNKCQRCKVQAVCLPNDEQAKCRANPAISSDRSTCCTEQVTATTTAYNDDDISEALCPGELVVTRCWCIGLDEDDVCDGNTVTTDAKTCRAHGSYRGKPVTAKACCGSLSGTVTVVSNPDIITDDSVPLPQKASAEKNSPTVVCPSNARPIACLLHTYWAHDYRSAEAVIDGARCRIRNRCERCAIQAICVDQDQQTACKDELDRLAPSGQIRGSSDGRYSPGIVAATFFGGLVLGVTITLIIIFHNKKQQQSQ